MLAEHTKKELYEAVKNICLFNNIPRFYLTQKLGKRRHFLTGYGRETFAHTRHPDITENITVSWQGDLTESEISTIVNGLTLLVKRVEQELKQSDD